MTTTLPPDMAKLRDFLPELVAEARKRVPYASCLLTRRSGMTVVKTKSEELVNPTPPLPGIRISVWDGASFHSAATNRLQDKDYLVRLTQDLAAAVRPRPGPMPEPEPELDQHFATEFKQDPEQVSTKDQQELCDRYFQTLVKADQCIVNAQVSYSHRREYRVFCAPNRLLSSDVRTLTVFMFAMAGDSGRHVMNYDFATGPGHEAAHLEDGRVRAVSEQAVQHLSAAKVPPGEHRVILDPDLTGTLAHESFGHGCEVDTLMRGAARALFYIGKRVGSDLVNITDFGGRQGLNGSLFFSDDGVVSAEPVVLVKAGILQPTLMTDRYSYLMMQDRIPGLRLSANGRLENYDHPVYARMTNTYFEPLPEEQGGMTRDQMVAATDSGILLSKITSGMEDPLGWGIQVQALRGEEIKGGRLTGKVFYKVGMTGFVPDVLASVDAVGSEFSLDSAGTCGKGHKEFVRTATGGPYLRCRMKLG